MRTRKLLAACLLAVTALLTTSCETAKQVLGNEQMQQLMKNVIVNMMGQRGTTYSYTGEGTQQQLTLKAGGTAFQDYNETTKSAAFKGALPVTINNTTANITIPTMKVGNGTISALTISNMVLAQDNAGTKISVGDNSMIDGTYTVDGTAYKASNLYIDALITSQQLNVTLMSIYFGDKGEQVVNVTFNGTAPEQK